MPRPTRDNQTGSAPASAPVAQGQPASVPNRARMATYDTGTVPAAPEDINFAERLGNVTPTSNPLTGEAAVISTDTTDIPIIGEDSSPLSAPPAPPAAPPTPAPVPVATSEQPKTFEVPEKYRNKSPEDLIKMHQEAERAFHQRDDEIHRARQNQLPPAPQVPVQTAPASVLPGDDTAMLEMMLAKPTQFKNAIVQDLMNTIGQSAQAAEVKRTFEASKTLIHTPEFGAFLQKVPPSVCQAADKDPQVLNYLLDSFKQTHQPPQSPVDSADKVRAQNAQTNAARSVATGTTGANQPTFTRLQLMEMQIKDPDRYAALQPEIMRLYAQNLI